MAVRRYGKMFFFSTTLMLASLHFVGWMSADDSFSIRHVGVSGCYILHPDEVIKAANIPLATRIMELDLRAVQQRVQQMPLVKSVSVARQFPAAIAIRIEEVSPIALLNHDGLHPLDERGGILPMPRRFNVLDVPVVSGPIVSKKITSGRLSEKGLAVIDYLTALRKYDTVLYHEISEAKLDARGGLVLYLMDGGVPVLMGKDQWLEKSEKLVVVLQHLKTQIGNSPVAEFDLRISGQVIARNKT
jgi:cell division septal protein FtsQ